MEKAESKLVRTKPAIRTDTKGDLVGIAFGLGLIMLSFGLDFILARTLFGERVFTIDIAAILRQWYVWVIILFVFAMPLLIAVAGARLIVFCVSGLINSNRWLRSAATTQASIVDRKVIADEEWNEYGVSTIYDHELELKYTPAKAMTDPGERTIWARVDKFLFDKYEQQDVARIHYSLVDPSVFLIEGE